MTPSRVSATIEFGIPALARAVERDVPHRLATFDERIQCVHRRVLFFRVRANCDIEGYVERTGPISLYGRGDAIIGSTPIYGAVSGQGANRFTRRIHGEAEAGVTVEAEARPMLRHDWSLDLRLSDSFHWTEPPVLHVLGRNIQLARYVEPRIREQLARVRVRAAEAVRRLDLHGKAETAWHHAFTPIELSDNPPVWLQLNPQSAAFAGVRADRRVLWGVLEIEGNAATSVGAAPAPVAATPLPPLGRDIAAPGKFEVILPVNVGYDFLSQKVKEVAAAQLNGDVALRDVKTYPSNGKLIVGLKLAKKTDTAPDAGTWLYLTATPQVDPETQTLRLPDLAALAAKADAAVQASGDADLADRLRQAKILYQEAYQRLLAAANKNLTRPLKNGFRMEGHLDSAKLDHVALLQDGVSIALRMSGDLKILYGL
ncbi:MAG: DUF4403 family protein [Methylovirgula sp.]|nr:DUF4403 family protein [Methylovirgula sp.]